MDIKEQREMDAWIAEHVFGFKWGHFAFVKGGLPDNPNEPIYLLPPDRFDCRISSCGRANPFPEERVQSWPKLGSNSLIPSYSSDPAAAMEVLKKCVERGKTVNGKHGEHNVILCQDCGEGEFWCGMDFAMVDVESMSQSAATLELAICLFARKLFEKEVA